MIKDLNIKTRYGTFDGFVDENGVKTWLGIPYAQPPVGNLRWQTPKHLQHSDKNYNPNPAPHFIRQIQVTSPNYGVKLKRLRPS